MHKSLVLINLVCILFDNLKICILAKSRYFKKVKISIDSYEPLEGLWHFNIGLYRRGFG